MGTVRPAGKRALGWVPEIALVAATTIAGLRAAGRWVDPVGDPGIWWSTIYRLGNGETLYRDVYLQFGPLSPDLLSLGVRLFGASASYFLLANWIPAIAAALVLLRAASAALDPLERLAVAGVLLSESLLAAGPGRLVFPYAPGAVHALFFSVLALLIGTRARGNAPAWTAGLLSGLAFCTKQEIGLACALALACSMPLFPRGFARAVRSGAAFVLVSLLGAAVVLSAAPLDSLRERSHLWPVAFVPPSVWNHLYRWVAGLVIADWKTILAHSAWWLLGGLATLSLLCLLLTWERKPTRWIPTAALLAGVVVWWGFEGFTPRVPFAPASLSMLVAALTVLLALIDRGLPARAQMVAFGIFAVLVGARAAFSTERFGPYSGIAHFASAYTWILFLCVLVPRILPGGDRAAILARRALGAAVLVVSGIGAVGGAKSLSEPLKETVSTPRGRVTVSREAAPFFRAIGANTRPGERAWVLPEINGVDALFDLRSVSPYVSHLPGWLDESAERELLRRVEKQPPDVVILFSRTVREYGVKGFGEGYDRLLAEWVRRRYSVVEEMPAGQILRRPGSERRHTDPSR